MEISKITPDFDDRKRATVQHNLKRNAILQIGDYGLAEERHLSDYIQIDKNFKLHQEQLPLRWLAPELRERILNHNHDTDLQGDP